MSSSLLIGSCSSKAQAQQTDASELHHNPENQAACFGTMAERGGASGVFKRDVLICQPINTQWFMHSLPANSGAYVSGHLLVANTAIERERRFAHSAGSSPPCLDRGRVRTASPHPPTLKQSHWRRLHAPQYLAAAFAGRPIGPDVRSPLRSSP